MRVLWVRSPLVLLCFAGQGGLLPLCLPPPS